MRPENRDFRADPREVSVTGSRPTRPSLRVPTQLEYYLLLADRGNRPYIVLSACRLALPFAHTFATLS